MLWAKCDLNAEVAYRSNKNLDLYQRFLHRSKVSGWPLQGWEGSPERFLSGFFSGSARSAHVVCCAAYLLSPCKAKGNQGLPAPARGGTLLHLGLGCAAVSVLALSLEVSHIVLNNTRFFTALSSKKHIASCVKIK